MSDDPRLGPPEQGAPRKYPFHVQLLAVVGIFAVCAALYGAVAGIDFGLRAVAVEPGCRRACEAQGEELREVHYTSGKHGKCFCSCTRADLRYASGDWAEDGVGIPVLMMLVLIFVGGGAWIMQRRSKRA